MSKKYKPLRNKDLIELVNDSNVDLLDIDVTEIFDFTGVFKNSTRSKEDLEKICQWNFENGRIFTSFLEGSRFDSDLSGCNFCRARKIDRMFAFSDFNHPIEFFPMGKVITTKQMFMGAKYFNQSVEGLDMSKVEDAEEMFAECPSFSQSIKNMNFSPDCNKKNIQRSANMPTPDKSLEKPLSQAEQSEESLIHRDTLF